MSTTAKKKVHGLVVSDLHLGGSCNVAMVLRVLEEHDYDWLIVVGDLFEEGEITPEEMKILDHLSENRRKVTYVDGNHDKVGRKFLKKKLRIPVVKFRQRRFGRKLYHFEHGDRFDKVCLIFSWGVIDRIFMAVVNTFRKWKILSDLFDSFHRGHSTRFEKKARAWAKRHNCHMIFCGHIHIAAKGDCYCNCGSFTGEDASYITIDEEGIVTLNIWCPESGVFKSL